MTSMTIEHPLLSSPTRVLPLGRLDTYDDGVAVVTLRSATGGAPVGISLPPEYRDVYEALDPSVTIPDAHGVLARLLRDFAADGIVKLLPEQPALTDFDVVVACLVPMTVKKILSSGYLLDAGGRDFEVSSLAMHMLPLLDGRRALRDVCAEVRDAVLTDDALRAAAQENETDTGQSLDELLAEESMILIEGLFSAGIGYFERLVPESEQG